MTNKNKKILFSCVLLLFTSFCTLFYLSIDNKKQIQSLHNKIKILEKKEKQQKQHIENIKKEYLPKDPFDNLAQHVKKLQKKYFFFHSKISDLEKDTRDLYQVLVIDINNNQLLRDAECREWFSDKIVCKTDAYKKDLFNSYAKIAEKGNGKQYGKINAAFTI